MTLTAAEPQDQMRHDWALRKIMQSKVVTKELIIEKPDGSQTIRYSDGSWRHKAASLVDQEQARKQFEIEKMNVARELNHAIELNNIRKKFTASKALELHDFILDKGVS
jgi:hypothetical protein